MLLGRRSALAGAATVAASSAALGPAQAKVSGRGAVAKMKAMPTNDDCFGRNGIRADGRFLCAVRLFQVKTRAESRMPWDLYNLVATTRSDRAWRPMSPESCPMVHA